MVWRISTGVSTAASNPGIHNQTISIRYPGCAHHPTSEMDYKFHFYDPGPKRAIRSEYWSDSVRGVPCAVFVLALSESQSNIGCKHLWHQSWSDDSEHSGRCLGRPVVPGTQYPRKTLQQNEDHRAGFFNWISASESDVTGAHLKEVMKSFIGFFDFMRPSSMAFPAKFISIPANVSTDFALNRVIPWATVDVYFESQLSSCGPMTNLDWLLMCWSIYKWAPEW